MVNKVILEKEASLTGRYQTTVPREIRTALKLNKGDKILFALNRDNSVTLLKAEAEEMHDDPALSGFLNLLERDMVEHPEMIVLATKEHEARMNEIVGDFKVDLDEEF